MAIQILKKVGGYMKTITTHFDNVELVAKKLKQLAKKCEKYGYSLPYEISTPYLKEVAHFNEQGEKIFSTHEKVVDVNLMTDELNPMLIEGDYQLIASLEYAKSIGMNYVKLYDNTYTIEQFQNIPLVCDHCHTNRDRKYGFVIKNLNTNELLTIGKSCVCDYLHSLDILYRVAIYDTIEKLDFSDCGGAYSVEKSWFTIEEVAEIVIACVNKNDFIKASDSSNNTAKQVADVLDARTSTDEVYRSMFFSTHKYEYNAETHQKAKDVCQLVKECDILFILNNDFNLRIIRMCENGFVSYRELNVFVYILSLYDRIKEHKVKETLKQQDNDNFFGIIGDKVDLTLTLLNQYHYEACYNGRGVNQYIYKMADETNRLFVWKTSKHFKELEVGKQFSIKGSIKDHSEYRGEKQTVLTRCKISI